jgi:hypothetical protein
VPNWVKNVLLRPKIRLSERFAVTNSEKQALEFPSEAMIRKFDYNGAFPHLAGIETWDDGEGSNLTFILSNG